MNKIPEGWPTREMVDAAWHEIFGKPRLETNGTERITYALTAALAVAPTPPAPEVDSSRDALNHASDWIGSIPHGENCFLHNDGGEFDSCFCGKDGVLAAIDDALTKQAPAPEVEPVAWMVPEVIDFSKVRSKGNAPDEWNGTVAWRAEVFCDSRHVPVTDKDGAKHYPRPLYTHPADDGDKQLLAFYREAHRLEKEKYDGLRKAAEEALGVLEDFNASETDIARVIKNLSAELDKVKS